MGGSRPPLRVTHLPLWHVSPPPPPVQPRPAPSSPSGLSRVLRMPGTILHAPGAERRLRPTGRKRRETVTGAAGGSKGSGWILAPSATRDAALGQRASPGLGTTQVPSGRALQRSDASASARRLGDTDPPSKRCTGLSVTVPRRGRRLTEQPPGPRRTAGSPTGQAPACRGRRPRGLGREDRINPVWKHEGDMQGRRGGSWQVSKFGVSWILLPDTELSQLTREHSLTHERGAAGGGHTRQRDPLPCGAYPAPGACVRVALVSGVAVRAQLRAGRPRRLSAFPADSQASLFRGLVGKRHVKASECAA